MVKLFLALTVIGLFNYARAADAGSKKIKLSQKMAAELVLKQGSKTKETNLTYLQYRLDPATALSAYDWKLTASSGYLFNKTQTFSPSMLTGAKYEQFQTDVALTKALAMTGTTIGFAVQRLSQKTDSTSTSTLPQQTQDSFGFTFEQSLLANSFGSADRATVTAAEKKYEANEVLRANDLENVVLDTIKLFWDTYVAQNNFKEALASRTRTSQLLESVKRKSSLGYTTPGDLEQTQAQFETREQNVKTASTDYLQKLDSLITTLGLEPGTEIEFIVTETIPAVPKLESIDPLGLRAVRSQKLKAEAAQELLTASKSKSNVTLNLVGKVYATGSDETAEGSFSSAVGGTHPQYYAGLKVQYNFGSDYLTEDVINKKAGRDLEEAKLARQTLEVQDSLAQAERQVQSTFAIAQSAKKQKDFYEKAVQQLNRTYTQGRTDIKTLIDVMNSYFSAEVQLSRAIGNYQIALNNLAATRDELIPDTKEKP